MKSSDIAVQKQCFRFATAVILYSISYAFSI